MGLSKCVKIGMTKRSMLSFGGCEYTFCTNPDPSEVGLRVYGACSSLFKFALSFRDEGWDVGIWLRGSEVETPCSQIQMADDCHLG